MLMIFALEADAVAISPARSITVVLDTCPERMIASSLTLTAMFSPGKSVCRCCSSVVIARLDDDVELSRAGRLPTRSG